MGDFEIDAVLYFMISKGGRVRNHELVTHFKNFLNHPVSKVQNREKFKDFVNELSTIKIDCGEKVLVLKKKYRPPSDDFDPAPVDFPTYRTSHPGPKRDTKKNISSQPDLMAAHSSSSSTPSITPSVEDSRPPPNDSLRAHSEPPNAVRGNNEEDLDSADGVGMSRVKSDEEMEVMMLSSDRIYQSTATTDDNISMGSNNGSDASLASAGSQKSSTSGVSSLVSSTSGVTAMDEDPNASIISVKDKIKKLNKNISESDVSQPKSNNSSGGNKKTNKHGADDDDTVHSSGSLATLDEDQRDWLIVCSYSEYHDMNRLLSKNSSLAKLKDFTNTALHWAAKGGKVDVIKLIANKPGVNVDERSGYTPLHLAAIHGHDHVIELLVQSYKADPNLRDYSGKKAKQYLKNSASSKSQQLLVSRRLGSDQSNVKILDDSFIRSASMRMSNRAKAMSSLLQVKSAIARQPLLRSSWNGSSDEMYEDRDRHLSLKTPPGSGSSSPDSFRRKKSSHDKNLMPPPSDSATKRRHQPSRVKSSSRDTSPSSRNGDNINMARSGSDPGLLEKTSTVV